MAATLDHKRAEELERQAKAAGIPTPRAAAELLIAADAAEYDALERARRRVWLRMAERLLRQHYPLDDLGRGMAENHPDRLDLTYLGELVNKDRMQPRRWIQRVQERPYSLSPPRYKPTTDRQDAGAGP